MKLQQLWEQTINIGVTPELSDWEQKRIRLLNGISVIPILTYFSFSFVYLIKQDFVIFWETFVFIFFSCIPVLFNYLGKFRVAAFVFIFQVSFWYIFLSLAHGPMQGAHYYFFPTCVLPTLFFRELRTILLLFLFNVACFFGVLYGFEVVKPFLFMKNGENLLYTNLLICFGSLLFVVYYFLLENRRQEEQLLTQNRTLAAEKRKSDKLLLNILPHEVAEELKETGQSRPSTYRMVTVMFTDIQNFTGISERMSPEKLLYEMNFCFSKFDEIIAVHNIEKIKTIGDAYMCAGGLPEKNESNPADVVRAALEIQDFMTEYRQVKEAQNEPFFEMRIGINTGPVVAGIIGFKKFAYDIWGDTVNVAARMETSGEVGRVNISANTYEIVKGEFRCTHRGKLMAKNKGEIDMYFVENVGVNELV